MCVRMMQLPERVQCFGSDQRQREYNYHFPHFRHPFSPFTGTYSPFFLLSSQHSPLFLC